MSSKKRLFLLGLVLFLIMCISGIYSLANEFNQTESGLSTGAVDIEILEYKQNNEPFSDDGKIVMPGDEILLNPRVNNLGIGCYIRTKISYKIDGNSFDESEFILGNYSLWSKEGDYYYYDDVLDPEATVDLFDKVKIPDLSPTYQGKNIKIQITVDAIQEKNFDGNWNDVEIIESVDRTYDIAYDGSSSIIFEENTSKYITLDENFFDNLGNLLPGDSVIEEISILNKSLDVNEFFLAIDYETLTPEEENLLQSIHLDVLDSEDEEIVSSNLGDKEKHSLGTYQSYTGKSLKIRLSVPPEIDNQYSKLFTKITWKFSYELIQKGNDPSNPNTWDLKFDLSIIVFIISTIGFLYVLFAWKNKSNNIEKNN